MFDDIIGKSNENEVCCAEDSNCVVCSSLKPRSLTDVRMEFAQFLDDPILKLGLINALSRDIKDFMYAVSGFSLYITDDERSSLAEDTINSLTGSTTRLTTPLDQLPGRVPVPTAAGSTIPAHNHNSGSISGTPVNHTHGSAPTTPKQTKP